ncbi:FUSC family protein [Streptomyces sp. N2-109]|uniref:FUSC family protein n=1 Tax=Streptomyces gossypii TaxID=2883101 RepID=A0ABT2JU35_9ACTN|nr:FUSC family protein [Streptomyces gossypii]MCT2591396.1 FUSC family protein [Streptomyces gossypii]
MLKEAFVAPDPGRLRLRSATRSVLGIGLAVLVCVTTGHDLPAVIAGGLAALLALFTVTDPTVRGQALTTALLPAAGLGVLVLTALLHEDPPARALMFVAVAGAGVYARRWGPRGHALGVFAFMTCFVTQFLRPSPAQLPELYSATVLAVLAASVVRFGLWCFERRLPPPATPSPPGGAGLARTTTRQAVQVVAAGGFALAVGQMLSPDRWYWAVGAVWWIFVNTTSRGETLVRGFRRVLGTVIGMAVGIVVAIPVDGAVAPTVALVAVCVFAIFYTAAVSYSWMMLAVTLMAALLYGLLGVLDPGLLALRALETGVGAAGAALAVAFVLPVTTHAATHAWIERAVRGVHDCTLTAARRLAGDPDADPAPLAAELDAVLGRARLSLAPLVHPLNPLRVRKARARQILALLDECAHEVRGLNAVSADPRASHDARLTEACHRVETAVQALLSPAHGGAGASLPAKPAPSELPAPGSSAPGARHRSAGESALHHLQGLEKLLTALATPLHSPPRSPLAGAARTAGS